MANSLIQYAYVSGEISPKLYGRTDLEKYDLGLSAARNWIIDYRGGMSTRPGTRYCDWLQHPQYPIKFFTFEFSPNVANTNLVIFGHGYIRFAQEGQYVLEAAKTVTFITAFSPAIVTSAAHGYAIGDLIKLINVVGPSELNNRTFEITSATTNTFTLKDQFGVAVRADNLPAFVSGQVARVYTLASPYTDDALEFLQAEQSRDLFRLTHYLYKTRDLKRIGTANWTLSETEFNAQITSPTGLSGFGSGSGTAGVAFRVTAVDFNNNESVASDIFLLTGIVNYSTTAGTATIAWNPVAGTKYYNVYRSTIVNDSTLLSRAVQFGLLGRAYGAYFVDTNIIPNFAVAAPQYNNPFADGAIQYLSLIHI